MKLELHKALIFGIAWLSTVTPGYADVPLVLEAGQFGLHADGKTDDGPAIQKMLKQVRSASGPMTIRFPEKKEIYVASGTGRYVFQIDRLHNVTIDGGGSTFLVQKDLRFLSVSACTNFSLMNLNVDITPAPVVEAVVLKQSNGGQILTVQLDQPERAGELGGPTKQDGEQDFFGMLWLPDKYTDCSYHYYVEAMTAESGMKSSRGTVQIHSDKRLPLTFANQIVRGKTRISLPVPGIAHRYGPGSMILIDRCTNVALTDIEVWSAPWFAFQIFRNDGDLTFRRVNIRPEPDSGRITSSWRDGFHVTGNKGRLLFEDCLLEGMNDDAFNVSTLGWKVTKVLAPDRIQIKQIFPIRFMPFQKDGNLLLISADGARRLAPARIVEIRGMPGDEIYTPADGTFMPKPAPELELVLDTPVAGLEAGCVLWDKTTANPDTVIRNCRIRNSCRFQSGVTLENCDVSALLYFYSDLREGPMPERITVRDCTLRQGRGHQEFAVIFNGWRGGKAPDTLPEKASIPMQNIILEGNKIFGGLKIDGANTVLIRKNQFPDGIGQSEIVNCTDVSTDTPQLRSRDE